MAQWVGEQAKNPLRPSPRKPESLKPPYPRREEDDISGIPMTNPLFREDLGGCWRQAVRFEGLFEVFSRLDTVDRAADKNPLRPLLQKPGSPQPPYPRRLEDYLSGNPMMNPSFPDALGG